MIEWVNWFAEDYLKGSITAEADDTPTLHAFLPLLRRERHSRARLLAVIVMHHTLAGRVIDHLDASVGINRFQSSIPFQRMRPMNQMMNVIKPIRKPMTPSRRVFMVFLC